VRACARRSLADGAAAPACDDGSRQWEGCSDGGALAQRCTCVVVSSEVPPAAGGRRRLIMEKEAAAPAWENPGTVAL
jgi:hypothetical protein